MIQISHQAASMAIFSDNIAMRLALVNIIAFYDVWMVEYFQHLDFVFE